MALLFYDGFDCYDNLADATGAGWGNSSDTTLAFQTTGGKNGGGAISNSTAGNWWGWALPSAVATGSTIYVCGWYIRAATGSSQILRLWNSLRSGTPVAQLSHNTSGDLSISNLAGTTVATIVGAIPVSTWCWIELKVILGTTTSNGTIEVRVNESVVSTTTSTNTNAAVQQIGFAAVNSSARWDDVMVLDGSGAGPWNTYPNTMYVDTLSPTGAGSINSWSGSNTDVDDAISASDGDSTYAAATTAATKANYAMANLADNPSTVLGVQIRAKAKKSNVGTKTMRTYVRSSASETAGAADTCLTDYTWVSSGPITLDPATAAQWTVAGVNGANAGIEVVS